MKQWQIVGEKMTGLFADWNNAELVHTAGEVRSERIATSTDPFVGQLADLADAIRSKRAPRVPLKDGAETLRIVLAAQRSADEGREITL
jgi:predicted dehydrogenase